MKIEIDKNFIKDFIIRKSSDLSDTISLDDLIQIAAEDCIGVDFLENYDLKKENKKLKLLKKSDPEFFNNYINKKKDEIYAAIYSKNELLIFYKKIECPPGFDRFNVIGINEDYITSGETFPFVGMVINANPLLILWHDERINTWLIIGFIKTKLKKIEQIEIYSFVDLTKNVWNDVYEPIEDIPFIRNFTI